MLATMNNTTMNNNRKHAFLTRGVSFLAIVAMLVQLVPGSAVALQKAGKQGVSVHSVAIDNRPHSSGSQKPCHHNLSGQHRHHNSHSHHGQHHNHSGHNEPVRPSQAVESEASFRGAETGRLATRGASGPDHKGDLCCTDTPASLDSGVAIMRSRDEGGLVVSLAGLVIKFKPEPFRIFLPSLRTRKKTDRGVIYVTGGRDTVSCFARFVRLLI